MAFCRTLRSVKELSCKASFPNGAFEVFKGSELFLDYKYWKCEHFIYSKEANYVFIIVTTVDIHSFHVHNDNLIVFLKKAPSINPFIIVDIHHPSLNLPLTRDRSHVRKAFGSPIYHFCFKFPKYNLSPKKYPIMNFFW